MLKFLREHGEKPRNKFDKDDAVDLFDRVFGKHVVSPLLAPIGTNAVNSTIGYDNVRYLKVAHIDNGGDFTIALVGKGICFDSGGMNIKTGGYMSGMKFDKLGALNVMAVGKELLKFKKSKANFLIIAPFAENMVSEASLCPDDILEYKVGKKVLRVEIENTDAEGRLVLADGILEAQARGADIIIDVATLTGAVVYALGDLVTGVLGNEELAKIILGHFEKKKEKAWILPIFKQHRDALEHQNKDVADVLNSAKAGKAGASTAAAFLEKFIHVKGVQWLHLDIAGSADTKGKARDGIAKVLLSFVKELAE
jgi:leucyl aminopeptidase